ncbi:methionine--tRNA ligase [bacterium]|nr:methionine--tRNA ligase [bacterium]
MKKNYYITTPIYYPNAQPHLGTLYSTLLADISARWQRLMGRQTFFLTGTDEHGQKIQEKAEAAGMPPKAFVDSIVPAYKDLWKLYGIAYDRFIRTTDADHEHGVEQWIKLLLEKGDIYKASYEGWYCVPCETFVNVGSEPLKNTDGHFICPNCKRGLKQLAEESYFFRLSAYQDRLLAFYETNPDFITPKERLQEVISFVKAGLKDLSLSRKTVSWGIPFPGDPSHTVYVWADALNNYLTGVGYGSAEAKAIALLKDCWPADAHVMAKDIVRFHAVYWPAFLMAIDLPTPKKLVVHGYILAGDAKMSKSLGNALDPAKLASWYGTEQIRYYLARQMAITHDGTFDLKDLEDRLTADLANSLGNLLNRITTLAANNDYTAVAAPASLEPASEALKLRTAEGYRCVAEEMDKYYFHTALAEVWKLIAAINAYVHEQQPWKLAKSNRALFEEVIACACNALYVVGLLLWPVMPNKMEELLACLGVNIAWGSDYDALLRANSWNHTFTLTKTEKVLFMRPESHLHELAAPQAAEPPKAAPAQENSNEISIDDVAKVQLVVGTITECTSVPNSDKLLCLKVDAGEYGQRQILSGVAKDLKPEELVGRQGVFIANLKPRKMAGMLSEGMMLYAYDKDGKNKLATVDGAANGQRVK